MAFPALLGTKACSSARLLILVSARGIVSFLSLLLDYESLIIFGGLRITAPRSSSGVVRDGILVLKVYKICSYTYVMTLRYNDKRRSANYTCKIDVNSVTIF